MFSRAKRKRLEAEDAARDECAGWWDTHSESAGHPYNVGPVLTLDGSAFRVECATRYCVWAHETRVE